MPRSERGTTPAGFRERLLARLRNHAREEKVSIRWLQQVVAFERLLARLPNTGEWIVKGGFSLELRYGWRFRETRDIDISTQLSLPEALATFREAIAESDLQDNFSFEITGDPEETHGAPGGGFQARIIARVAGEVFAQFHVDIASKDAIFGGPDYFEGSSLLAFTNIEPINFPIYPVPQQLAEKLHAYTLPRNVVNTRAKDLVDIVRLITVEIVGSEELRASVRATFHRRDTHDEPQAFPPPPPSWSAPFARLASLAPTMPTQDLSEGWRLTAEFWDPILSGKMTSGTWFPRPKAWEPTNDR